MKPLYIIFMLALKHKYNNIFNIGIYFHNINDLSPSQSLKNFRPVYVQLVILPGS